jgi:hypothetical protein
MFGKRKYLKVNNEVLLRKNKTIETRDLRSCLVCVITIENLSNKYVVMSHYRIIDIDKHVSKIHSIIKSITDSEISKVTILLFRLASEKLKENHSSPGVIYNVEKYESTLNLFMIKLIQILPNAEIYEIPYYAQEKSGDWVRVNTRKGTWVASFGSGRLKASNDNHVSLEQTVK